MSNLDMLLTLAAMKLATEVSNFLTKEECQQMNGLKDNSAMMEMTKDIMPKFFNAMIENDEVAQKQMAQQIAEAIRLQLRPKLDERTARFIGQVLYDLNPEASEKLLEHFMGGYNAGPITDALNKLYGEWNEKPLNEQQVRSIGELIYAGYEPQE